jgi:hypothetical protein
MEGATIEGNPVDICINVEHELELLSAALEARHIIPKGTKAHRSVCSAYSALREAGRSCSDKDETSARVDLTFLVCLQDNFIETSPAGFKAIVSEATPLSAPIHLSDRQRLTKLLEDSSLNPFLVVNDTVTKGGIMLPGADSLDRYKDAVEIPRDYELRTFLGYKPIEQRPTANIKNALIVTYFLGDGVAAFSYTARAQNMPGELMVFHGGFLVFSSNATRYLHWPRINSRPARRLCGRTELEK